MVGTCNVVCNGSGRIVVIMFIRIQIKVLIWTLRCVMKLPHTRKDDGLKFRNDKNSEQDMTLLQIPQGLSNGAGGLPALAAH